MKKVACYTLGCKVNSYESEAMLEQFARAGFQVVDPKETADIYLVNTCTVTQIAARKSRQVLSRMRGKNPEALIVACGCYVEQETDDRHRSPSREDLESLCDLVITNRQKEHIVSLVKARLEGNELPSTEKEDFFISSPGSKTRAFLKVQDGCRQFCSYCIIPYVRGPLTSKPPAQAVEEARVLAENGCREIVLTGIHLSSYGRDLEQNVDLADLITAMEEIPALERIRLGSLEVGLITEPFISRIRGLKKLCPHFHLSLQSGAGKTLKAMNRRYLPEEFEKAAVLLKEAYPDAAITTDVIVGFPGETEEDHQESMEFVRRLGFADLHVFPYSPREGTAAALRKDQVSSEVKTRRSHEMIETGRQSAKAFAESFLGRTMEVLLEQKQGNVWEGYTANYLKVRFPHQEGFDRNQLIPVKINCMEWVKNDIVLVGEVRS